MEKNVRYRRLVSHDGLRFLGYGDKCVRCSARTALNPEKFKACMCPPIKMPLTAHG